MYALVDCNNFYASCERLFRPDLRQKPLIVLSSNDGCVIARSNEAKRWVEMGAPYFKIKALCKLHDIHVFSSNFVLYGDLSQRIMSIIRARWTDVEIYSIDEAFLNLKHLPEQEHHSFCNTLQQSILKSTGIPTSIGIGKTKTLAKAANHLCKKILKTPVFNLNKNPEWLSYIKVEDVWGVGRQSLSKLNRINIHTAYDLATSNMHQLKRLFNVTLMRTAMELQGTACHTTDDIEPRHSILSSKSFATMQTELNQLTQALSGHCATAYEKLRSQQLLAHRVHVFIRTNRFRQDLPQYHNDYSLTFMIPTDDLRIITQVAIHCLQQLYQPNYQYKKVGVCLENLTAKTHQQLNFFQQESHSTCEKTTQLLNTFDAINHKFGRHTIKLAAEGYYKPRVNADMRSPSYTTQWHQLPVAKCL
jgi:DNA polymerase V